MLFPSYIRDNHEPKKRKETAYEFIDRSAWKISELVRQKLNEWTEIYYADEEFIRMFKSKFDKQHYSAVFELLTFTLFNRSGFTLSRHPETSTSKKPDFKAICKDFRIYLECTLAGHSFDSVTEKNRMETVEEILEEMDYFPYWINVGFRAISDKSISKKKLLKFIDKVKHLSEEVPNEALCDMQYLYEEDNWELEISLLRKTKPGIKRSLGYVLRKAKTINTGKPILTALNDKKASQYGITDEPYIICLNTSDLFTIDACFGEALFGQNGDNKIDLRYNLQNSFYLFDNKPVNTSVSAVIIFRNFDLYTLDSSSISVWHNPYAKNKIATGALPFDEYVFELKEHYLERTIFKKEKDLFQILAIEQEEYIKSKNKSNS